jgi:hypothetical protein
MKETCIRISVRKAIAGINATRVDKRNARLIQKDKPRPTVDGKFKPHGVEVTMKLPIPQVTTGIKAKFSKKFVKDAKAAGESVTEHHAKVAKEAFEKMGYTVAIKKKGRKFSHLTATKEPKEK